MGLPHMPESIESARERFHKALFPVIDVKKCATDPNAYRPGLFRRHVFDFEDGIRLIASRDRMPNGQHCLHLSFSVGTSGTVFEPTDFGVRCVDISVKVAGTSRPPDASHTTAVVFHLFWKED